MRLGVLAAALAGVVVLGHSFAAVGTAELVTSRLMQAVLDFAGYALMIFAAMRLCWRRFQHLEKRVKDAFRCYVAPRLFGWVCCYGLAGCRGLCACSLVR